MPPRSVPPPESTPAAAYERLREASKRMLVLQENERRHLSQALHDDVGQSLTALKIGLHRLSTRVGEPERPLLAECLAIADQVLDTLRSLSQALRPPQLDQLGLDEALSWLVERQRAMTGIDIDLTVRPLPRRLPAEVEVACYRIAQEALDNAARHARATRIDITVASAGGTLTLSIQDDGVGFDPAATGPATAFRQGAALTGMAERAELAGGQLHLASRPGDGVTLLVKFPLGG